MYYLKCKHCNHLNEVKSEYLVVCGLCNRKLEDNYKESETPGEVIRGFPARGLFDGGTGEEGKYDETDREERE